MSEEEAAEMSEESSDKKLTWKDWIPLIAFAAVLVIFSIAIQLRPIQVLVLFVLVLILQLLPDELAGGRLLARKHAWFTFFMFATSLLAYEMANNMSPRNNLVLIVCFLLIIFGKEAADKWLEKEVETDLESVDQAA